MKNHVMEFNAEEWQLIHALFDYIIGPNFLLKPDRERAILNQLYLDPSQQVFIKQTLREIQDVEDLAPLSVRIEHYVTRYLEPSPLLPLTLGPVEVHLKSTIDLLKYIYFNSYLAWSFIMGNKTPIGIIAEESEEGVVEEIKTIDREQRLYLKDGSVELLDPNHFIYEDEQLTGIKTKGGRQRALFTQKALEQLTSGVVSKCQRKQQAKKRIVIVGSGPVGAIAAKILCDHSFEVVMLESGSEKIKDNYALMDYFIQHNAYWQSNPAWEYQSDGFDLALNTWAIRQEGGGTNAWNGSTPRFLQSDFIMHSLYGIAVDWPITYEELEPYYVKAEHLIGVSGDDDDPLQSPRSQPFPMPAHPMRDYDLLVKKSAKPLGIDFHTIPGARNARTYDDRSKCLNYGVCRACPINAKYTAGQTIHELKQHHNFRIEYHAHVHHIIVRDEGSFTVDYKQDDVEHSLPCDLLILAGYVVGNISLLLQSKSDYFPLGLGNSSHTLGRYLMDHPRFSMTGKIDHRVDGYRSGFETASSINFHNTPLRAQQTGGRILVHRRTGPWPYELAIASLLTGKALQQEVKDNFAKCIRLDVLMEQLPLAENKIELIHASDASSEYPSLKITYKLLTDYENRGYQYMREQVKTILQHIPAHDLSESEVSNCGHFMGGHRMGNDPRTAVTNSYCESHDVKKLFIAGSGCFPTGSTSNPTLTSIALTVRMAEYICCYYG